jgi:hypothetical protein
VGLEGWVVCFWWGVWWWWFPVGFEFFGFERVVDPWAPGAGAGLAAFEEDLGATGPGVVAVDQFSL